MKRTYIIIGILLVLGAIVYFTTRGSSSVEQNKPLLTTVSKGSFDVKVKATGELRAKNSVKIRGPKRMRDVGIWNTTISRILPEGSTVKKGGWIASLDKSGITGKYDETRSELEKIETQLEQEKIDTTIELSGMRDQLGDLKFDMREKELLVEQSQFEAKMVIQQAQLNLERIQRDYDQLEKNYVLKKKQKKARIAEINASLRQQKRKLAILDEISQEFDVTAPEDGMLIYLSSWNGEKTGVGSQISAWNPIVAELPDLTSMISVTYVNEVDISKVKMGQDVLVGIDAFPDKQFKGMVTQVANVGQQLRNQDAKVFEVIIEVLESDSTLRPAMTTSNEITVRELAEVVFIPLEALQMDSLAYVFTSLNGNAVRQEVLTGHVNDNYITIELGLEGGEDIYLEYNGDKSTVPWSYLDDSAKEDAKQAFDEANAKYNQAMNEKSRSTKRFDGQLESGGADFIIIN